MRETGAPNLFLRKSLSHSTGLTPQLWCLLAGCGVQSGGIWPGPRCLKVCQRTSGSLCNGSALKIWREASGENHHLWCAAFACFLPASNRNGAGHEISTWRKPSHRQSLSYPIEVPPLRGFSSFSDAAHLDFLHFCCLYFSPGTDRCSMTCSCELVWEILKLGSIHIFSYYLSHPCLQAPH